MKKFIAILLAVFILLLLPACQAEDESRAAHYFYYLRADILYGAEDAVISAETLEPDSASANDLLNRYILGPSSEHLVSPFPEGTRIKSIKQSGDSLLVYLSSDFLALSGLEHTLACACLAKTCFSLYNITEITIRVEGNDQSTTLTPNLLTLIDTKDAIHATIGTEVPTP